MSKTIDFTELPIGTEVWYLGKVRGVIIAHDHATMFPVEVKHDGAGAFWYKATGEDSTLNVPVLFLRPFDLVIPDEAYELHPPPDPPIDSICYVSDYSQCLPDGWAVGFWKGRDAMNRPMVAATRLSVPVPYAHVRFTDPYLEAGE